MTVSWGAVVIGTPDPPALAEFYRALLGWEVVDSSPEWVRLRSPERERPGLSFQLEPTHVPPEWPQTATSQQMQMHLDLLVDDLAAATARAIALGAEPVGDEPVDGVQVLRDPHGHLFCLFVAGA